MGSFGIHPFARLAGFALACGVTLGALSSDGRAESVNRLLVEAREALTSADFEPDAPAQLVLLRQALDLLDRIVSEHADNPMADQIINGGKVAGTSRPAIEARIARLRSQPEICFRGPDAGCLIAVASGFSGSFASLRDRVAADVKIADALMALGETNAAMQRIDGSMKSAVRIKSASRRARALIRIADALARLGDRSGALRSLGHASKATETLDAAAERSRLTTQIASGLVGLEQYEQARSTLRRAMSDATEVKKPNAKIELLTRLARLFQEAGDRADAELLIDSARLTMAKIEDPYDLAWARIGMAHTLHEMEQTSAAEDLVEAAIQAATAVGDPRIKASLITEAAGRLSDWGAEDRASDLLDDLQSEALALQDASARRQILWWIARTRIAAGHTPSARMTLEFALEEVAEIPVGGQTGSFAKLAVALAKTGDVDAAEKAIAAAHKAALGLSGEGRQATALLSVAVALAQMDEGAAAAQLLPDVWTAGGYRKRAFTARAGIEPLLTIAIALAEPADHKAIVPVTPRN